METISKIFNHQLDPRTHGTTDRLVDDRVFVGLELELEQMAHLVPMNLRSTLVQSNFWRYHYDDSLRDCGTELIMAIPTGEPLRGADIIEALEVLREVLDTWKAVSGRTPAISKRTSTHVHIDVRDFDIEQIQRYAMLWVVFEEVLFNWSAPKRARNNYSRSAMEFPDVEEQFGQLFDLSPGHPGNMYHFINENGRKYDALNLYSMVNLGTLEFRAMGGCYDPDRLLEWINILLSMRQAAKDSDLSLQDIPEQMSAVGIESVLYTVFKDYADLLRPFAPRHVLLRGVRRMQGLLTRKAYSAINRELSSSKSGKADNPYLLNFKKKTISSLKAKAMAATETTSEEKV